MCKQVRGRGAAQSSILVPADLPPAGMVAVPKRADSKRVRDFCFDHMHLSALPPWLQLGSRSVHAGATGGAALAAAVIRPHAHSMQLPHPRSAQTQRNQRLHARPSTRTPARAPHAIQVRLHAACMQSASADTECPASVTWTGASGALHCH